MAAYTVVIECPYCDQVLEVKSPDKLHSAFSFEKPMAKSYHGSIIKKEVMCPNPSCQKQFQLFWYAPLEYFSRI